LIQDQRLEFIKFLNENYQDLLKVFKVINYEINFEYMKSEISVERFNKYEVAEISSKNTLVGPHKDDFDIKLNKTNITEFGSRGQQRMGILVLKLLELKFISNKTNTKPILLLDDIFSELDDNNKNAILNIIPNQQTIITSVDLIPQINNFSVKIVDLEKEKNY
jgi:DNA replication and repair protein RecF